MNNSVELSPEEGRAIMKLLKNSPRVDQFASKYVYNEDETNEKNMEILASSLATFLALSTPNLCKSLQAYLQMQNNIPIEINFRPLKSHHVVQMVQAWVKICSSSSEKEFHEIRLSNHLNPLFKQMLFETKNQIDEYFLTISPTNKLKGVDLYQLLSEILSNYYLYEYNCDSEAFFDKVNSFNSFLEVVTKFQRSNRRVIFENSQQDIHYIRRFEFEELVEFWQIQNHELTLQTEKRRRIANTEVQTESVKLASSKTQTDRPILTLEIVINNALHDLNQLTEFITCREKLESIERIYQNLRKEKLNLLSSQMTPRNFSSEKIDCPPALQPHIDLCTSVLIESFDDNNSEHETGKTEKKYIPLEKNSKQINVHRSTNSSIVQPMGSLTSPRVSQLQPIQKPNKNRRVLQLKIAQPYSLSLKVQNKNDSIFRNLFELYSNEPMQLQMLHQLLSQLGVISKSEVYFVLRLLKEHLIADIQGVVFEEFVNIMKHVMQQDKSLTMTVIEEFIDYQRQRKKKMPMKSQTHRSYVSASHSGSKSTTNKSTSLFNHYYKYRYIETIDEQINHQCSSPQISSNI